MTPREQFLCLLPNTPLEKTDAIVVLEGDGLVRVDEAAHLYKQGWAPVVVLSGGYEKQPNYAVPARNMLPALIERGVPRDVIVLEEVSQHTHDQAVECMKLVKKRGWKKIILVASYYHQYRAFLTFLYAMRESNLSLHLINAPVRDIAWWQHDGRGVRIENLAVELDKIEEYRKRWGHVASYEEGIQYLQWKESQR